MNNTLIKISKHIRENLEKFLPEIKLTDLEENGKIYYMNGDDGTIFDWDWMRDYVNLWCFMMMKQT